MDFELDIGMTSDNKYVAVHSWSDWQKMTEYKGVLPPNLKNFKKYKIHDKFKALDITDINLWFSKHKDAVLITDKVDSPLKFSQEFEHKNRLIMELFTWGAVFEGIENGIDVMPTWNLISLLGDNKLNKLLDFKIDKIAAPNSVVYKYPELLREMSEYIKVYSFGTYGNGLPRESRKKDEHYVICNESEYFYGVYADIWDFSINCNRNKNVIK